MKVVVLGASADRSKFGNRAVRAYAALGHVVVPINPRLARAGESIEGLACVASVANVVGPIDRLLVYLPAVVMLAELPAIAARGDIAEVWLNPGADDPAVVVEATRLGLNVVQACALMAIGH